MVYICTYFTFSFPNKCNTYTRRMDNKTISFRLYALYLQTIIIGAYSRGITLSQYISHILS